MHRFRGKVLIATVAITALIIALALIMFAQRARSTDDLPLSPAEIAKQEGYSVLVLDSKRITAQVDARITALLKERYGTHWVTWTVHGSQGPVKVYAYPTGDRDTLAALERDISGLLSDAPSK